MLICQGVPSKRKRWVCHGSRRGKSTKEILRGGVGAVEKGKI